MVSRATPRHSPNCKAHSDVPNSMLFLLLPKEAIPLPFFPSARDPRQNGQRVETAHLNCNKEAPELLWLFPACASATHFLLDRQMERGAGDFSPSTTFPHPLPTMQADGKRCWKFEVCSKHLGGQKDPGYQLQPVWVCLHAPTCATMAAVVSRGGIQCGTPSPVASRVPSPALYPTQCNCPHCL